MESGQAQCGALTAIKERTAKGSRDRHTDRQQKSGKGGRQDTSVYARPPEKPASQTLDQGQRLLANTQHAGDKTAMTGTAERDRAALLKTQLLVGERHNVEGFG